MVDPTKRIQSVEEIQSTEWMQLFNAQRNSFGMYLPVMTQIRDLRAANGSCKIGGVLQCRFQFLRILLMVKVVKALTTSSIKGVPRDVRSVIQDRLYSALNMLQSNVKALAPGQSKCVHTLCLYALHMLKCTCPWYKSCALTTINAENK